MLLRIYIHSCFLVGILVSSPAFSSDIRQACIDATNEEINATYCNHIAESLSVNANEINACRAVFKRTSSVFKCMELIAGEYLLLDYFASCGKSMKSEKYKLRCIEIASEHDLRLSNIQYCDMMNKQDKLTYECLLRISFDIED